MGVAAGDSPPDCRLSLRLTKLRVNNTENAKQIKQYYFYVQFWRNFTATNEVYTSFVYITLLK